MASCSTACEFLYPNKLSFRTYKWDERGLKQCHNCEFTISTSDTSCKCCGNRFRVKMRNKNCARYYHKYIKKSTID